jgi:hypothetical protein
MRRSPNSSPSNPLARAQRRFRREQVLGPDAACACCGERCPDALREVPGRLFEAHHPFGKQHEPTITVILCCRCHAIASMRQVDDGVNLRAVSTALERLGDSEGALGSHLLTVREELLKRSKKVRALIEGLDRDYPAWRDQPWAK